TQELVDVIGINKDDVILASAKANIGIEDILERIVEAIPPPAGEPEEPLKALIFDSLYDSYRGVIAYVCIKEGSLKVGDKIKLTENPADTPLPGYRPLNPMVFCGLFPIDSNNYNDLREALERLELNDSALQYEPETSQALGFGFRCGFLGLLHMEIIQE